MAGGSAWRCPAVERDRQTLRGKKTSIVSAVSFKTCLPAASVVSALPSQSGNGHSRFGRGRGNGTARRFTAACCNKGVVS